jgi:hypothetical protein
MSKFKTKLPFMFVARLPFRSIQKDFPEFVYDCGLWKSKENICELRGDNGLGVCDISGLFYGTTEAVDTKFCARHFYMEVLLEYQLEDITRAA